MLLFPFDAPLIANQPQALADRVKHFLRQHAVAPHAWLGARDRPQIDTWPDEFVCFAEHDPGRIGVEPEVPSYLGRQGHGPIRLLRRVGDWQNSDAKPRITFRTHGDNNDAWAVLARLSATLACLVAPKKGIAADEAGKGCAR